MKRQFSKDGRVTTATSAAQAVRLTYDGWREAPAAADPDPTPAAAEEPEKPTPDVPRKRTSNRS